MFPGGIRFRKKDTTSTFPLYQTTFKDMSLQRTEYANQLLAATSPLRLSQVDSPFHSLDPYREHLDIYKEMTFYAKKIQM